MKFTLPQNMNKLKFDRMTEGIIYKAINIETNLVYIGATTKSVTDRKQDHIQKSVTNSNIKFHEAITTYGLESFVWEDLDTALSIDELAMKEIHYIQEFNTYSNGYNSDRGGGFKKTIYKYNLDGTLNSTFDNLNEAGESVNVRKQDISRACLNINNTLKDFYWSYDYSENFTPKIDTRKRVVLQFNLVGDLLNIYVSASDASRQSGISKTCISRCCRGERNQSGGFIWNYS